MKQQILTLNAPAPGGAYSQAIRVCDFVFTAGMGPWQPATRQVVVSPSRSKRPRPYRICNPSSKAAGLGLKDVVKTTVHLSDLSLFSRFNDVYSRFFPDPKPVRTTVGSQLLGIWWKSMWWRMTGEI